MSSQPPPSFYSRILPALVFVLAIIGIPAAALVAFFTLAMTHPLLFFGFLLLYELLALSLRFAIRVYQKVESQWVDRVSSWLVTNLSLNNYSNLYKRYLLLQHGDFDVKGLITQGSYTPH